MADTTARWGLPLLAAGQAQKEMTHNEALALIDLGLAAAVEEVGRTVPPDSPQPGQAWIVGAAPTGDWAGEAGAIAGWTAGGWRFLPPREGLSAWSRADSAVARFRSAAWEIGQLRGARLLLAGLPVVGPRQPAVADPAGGATVDTEARGAIGAVLAALRTHGLIAP